MNVKVSNETPEVNNPYFISHFLIGHLLLSGIWIAITLRMDTKKICVFIRDWIACSKYNNFSRLHSQHNLKGGGRPV